MNNLASPDDLTPGSTFALISCLTMSLLCIYIPTLELQLRDVAGSNVLNRKQPEDCQELFLYSDKLLEPQLLVGSFAPQANHFAPRLPT